MLRAKGGALFWRGGCSVLAGAALRHRQPSQLPFPPPRLPLAPCSGQSGVLCPPQSPLPPEQGGSGCNVLPGGGSTEVSYNFLNKAFDIPAPWLSLGLEGGVLPPRGRGMGTVPLPLPAVITSPPAGLGAAIGTGGVRRAGLLNRCAVGRVGVPLQWSRCGGPWCSSHGAVRGSPVQCGGPRFGRGCAVRGSRCSAAVPAWGSPVWWLSCSLVVPVHCGGPSAVQQPRWGGPAAVWGSQCGGPGAVQQSQ